MGTKYVLTPIQQPTPKVCFQTALLILDKYRRGKQPPSTSYSNLQAQFDVGANIKNLGMLNKEQATEFAKRYGFSWRFVETTPHGFLSALTDLRGPFAYVGDLPNDRPYQHTIVVTGIIPQKHQKQLWTMSYIDPWQGKQHQDEFYSTLRKYIPFEMNERNGTKIYFSTPTSGVDSKPLEPSYLELLGDSHTW